MVACQLPKLNARVRFPLPAPTADHLIRVRASGARAEAFLTGMAVLAGSGISASLEQLRSTRDWTPVARIPRRRQNASGDSEPHLHRRSIGLRFLCAALPGFKRRRL